MNRIFPVVAAAIVSLSIVSCGNNESGEKAATTESVVATHPDIELASVSASPEFKDAQISVSAMKGEKAGADSTKISFVFDVKNYELTAQTADHEAKLCNNSGQGQHIHFIMDNMPYKALYEPKNEITLANNTEHYLMVFLSRSYHESVKSPGAAAVVHFKIDEKGKVEKLAAPTTPMIFYSRPKGDYIGKDTENILLDYYVWQNGPATGDFAVQAMLLPANGVPKDTVTFMLDKWEPKFLKNLPMGKNTLTLTLTDKNGQPMTGPNASATRTFNLAAQEPMQ